ncbi:unnamed protein product, partial [Porites lobata]
FFTYRYGTFSQVATFIHVGSDEMIPYNNKPAYFLPTLLMFWEFQIEQRSRRVIYFSNFGYLEKQSLNGNRRRNVLKACATGTPEAAPFSDISLPRWSSVTRLSLSPFSGTKVWYEESKEEAAVDQV